MTHTLHRSGQPEDLSGDFVVFTMSAKQVNAAGSAEKMKKFIEIVEKYNPLNFGDMKTGNVFNVSRDDIHEQVRDTSIVHFVFNDQDTVAKVLAELKEAALGPSVVVSGLVDGIKAACGQAGLNTHTIEFSGGVHGRTELLPDEKTLSLTTMCGHGMIAKALVKHLAGRVKRGKLSMEEAAVEMARPCQCGIFNTDRAKRLIQEIIDTSD